MRNRITLSFNFIGNIISRSTLKQGIVMKKILTATTLMLVLGSSIMAEDSAEKLFTQKCMGCHLSTKPTQDQLKTIVAPAIMGVMRHIKKEFSNKKEAVDFIVEYTLNPTKEKSICRPKKIKKFGLMPSQKENLTKEELQLIAEYLYDNFPPENFRGMGRGIRF